MVWGWVPYVTEYSFSETQRYTDLFQAVCPGRNSSLNEQQLSSKQNLPEIACMTDVSHSTSCTVFPPQVTCLNTDSLLSSSSFVSLCDWYHSFFSHVLHAGETLWSLAKLCNVVKEIYGTIFCFQKAAPPISALVKNLPWGRPCEFQQWRYLTGSLPQHAPEMYWLSKYVTKMY